MSLAEDQDTVVETESTMLQNESSNPYAADDDDGVEMVIMKDSSGNEFILDDFPCSGPIFMEMPEQDQQLVAWAMMNRTVVVSDITFYVYCTSVGSWSQMQSKTAAHALCTVLDLTVPVNYMTSLDRYYSLITRIAFAIGKVQRSICIGTWRLLYEVEYIDGSPVVKYIPHPTVIESPPQRGPEHRRQYMFVTRPIPMPYPFHVPSKIFVDFEHPVLNQIMLPLRDDQKLDFAWRIGKAFQGENENPTVIIFYGKSGHEGKSVLATNISRVLTTGVVWTIDDLIGKVAEWPDAEDVMIYADKRIIICDEVKIDEDFNYNNIKRWTSGSPIQSKGLSAYLCQTVIGITNKIGWYKKEAVSNSIGRRLIIYKMDKSLGDLQPFEKSSITNTIRMQFISYCLAMADRFKYPPTSLEIAVYTIFRKSSNWITAGMEFDSKATHDDCATATRVMSTRAGVSTERLVQCFSAISKPLVYKPQNETGFVLGIRCMMMKMTDVGRDHVDQNSNMQTISLEDLKDIARETPNRV